MSIRTRSESRRKRMEVHRARDFADAERWDLEFWYRQWPEARLSALVSLRDDCEKVIRGHYGKARVNWIDLDSLIKIKSKVDHPRHQEDVRVLLEVKRLRKKR